MKKENDSPASRGSLGFKSQIVQNTVNTTLCRQSLGKYGVFSAGSQLTP